jgi:hypothetical protein
MKYIITESKINNMIKDYILKNQDVIDVDFETKRVHLGSGPNEKGETSVEKKVIVIYINNIKNTKNYGELKSIKLDVANSLENLFGIDFRTYGSEWDLNVYQVKRAEI